MSTMRAAWYEQQGAPADVLVVGEMECPTPGPGEVRVRIQVAGLNPSDTYGRLGRNAPMPFPRIVPGQDGAGVIDQVGEGVPASRVGERVWVYEANRRRPFGTSAEYTTVPAIRAVRLPDGANFEEGACLGVPALTAHRALFVDGPVRGLRVLVTGGAGAVGSAAIQLARWGSAARIIATVSSDAKAVAAREAGADEIVNYRTENVVEAIQRLTGGDGVDRIVDVDFGGNLATSLQVLKNHGSLASYASRGAAEPPLPFRFAMMKNLNLHGVLVYEMPEEAKTSGAADITQALERQLRPMIGKRLPLTRVAEAHADVEAGAVIGNVVVEIG